MIARLTAASRRQDLPLGVARLGDVLDEWLSQRLSQAAGTVGSRDTVAAMIDIGPWNGGPWNGGPRDGDLAWTAACSTG
jgi:hypothetical protein